MGDEETSDLLAGTGEHPMSEKEATKTTAKSSGISRLNITYLLASSIWCPV
ncbi:MAG: hypothetical protein HY694_14575 [Deltaproteobacteria bacterium]|nr:hypothetical protein [Deltaproteobacteria bacterium]